MDEKLEIRYKMLRNLENLEKFENTKIGIKDYYNTYITFMPKEVGEIIEEILNENKEEN